MSGQYFQKRVCGYFAAIVTQIIPVFHGYPDWSNFGNKRSEIATDSFLEILAETSFNKLDAYQSVHV